jgi:hypothetical protein
MTAPQGERAEFNLVTPNGFRDGPASVFSSRFQFDKGLGLSENTYSIRRRVLVHLT